MEGLEHIGGNNFLAYGPNGEEYFIELGASEYDYHTSDLYYYALRYTIAF